MTAIINAYYEPPCRTEIVCVNGIGPVKQEENEDKNNNYEDKDNFACTISLTHTNVASWP